MCQSALEQRWIILLYKGHVCWSQLLRPSHVGLGSTLESSVLCYLKIHSLMCGINRADNVSLKSDSGKEVNTESFKPLLNCLFELGWLSDFKSCLLQCSPKCVTCSGTLFSFPGFLEIPVFLYLLTRKTLPLLAVIPGSYLGPFAKQS